MGEKSYLNSEWEDYSEKYARDHEVKHPEKYWQFHEVVRLLKSSAGENLLEIGCNTGELCWFMKRYKVNVTGIDISKTAIEIARRKYPDIEFRNSSLYELFQVEKYDAVIMLNVIEHLKKPTEALSKIKKLLRPEGRLLLSCPNKWAFVNKVIYKMSGKQFAYDPTHLLEYSPRSLRELLTGADFAVEKMTTKPLVPRLQYISEGLPRKLPAWLFGGHIFVVGRKI